MISKRSIIITDILLIIGLVMCLISDKDINPDSAWQASHCIISAGWFILMAFHVWQHWKLIKAFQRSKVRLKNILTTLTIVVFVVMFFSIAILIVMTTPCVVHFHNMFAHVFMIVVIAHLIAKTKRLQVMIQGKV